MSDPGTTRSEACEEARPHQASRDIRCECHRLLARLHGEILELSCPRCKRKIVIDMKELARNQPISESLRFK